MIFAAKLLVQITSGILVVGKQQYLLPFEFAREKLLQSREFGIIGRGDRFNVMPDFTQGIHISTEIVMQSLEIIQFSVQGRQSLDELASLCMRI